MGCANSSSPKRDAAGGGGTQPREQVTTHSPAATPPAMETTTSKPESTVAPSGKKLSSDQGAPPSPTTTQPPSSAGHESAPPPGIAGSDGTPASNPLMAPAATLSPSTTPPRESTPSGTPKASSSLRPPHQVVGGNWHLAFLAPTPPHAIGDYPVQVADDSRHRPVASTLATRAKVEHVCSWIDAVIARRPTVGATNRRAWTDPQNEVNVLKSDRDKASSSLTAGGIRDTPSRSSSVSTDSGLMDPGHDSMHVWGTPGFSASGTASALALRSPSSQQQHLRLLHDSSEGIGVPESPGRINSRGRMTTTMAIVPDPMFSPATPVADPPLIPTSSPHT